MNEKAKKFKEIKLKVKVLKPFRYAVDCRTIDYARPGDEVLIDRSAYKGLVKEGFIEKKIIKEVKKEVE